MRNYPATHILQDARYGGTEIGYAPTGTAVLRSGTLGPVQLCGGSRKGASTATKLGLRSGQLAYPPTRSLRRVRMLGTERACSATECAVLGAGGTGAYGATECAVLRGCTGVPGESEARD
eukprot:2859441-Rhodomonas_salina.1